MFQFCFVFFSLYFFYFEQIWTEKKRKKKYNIQFCNLVFRSLELFCNFFFHFEFFSCSSLQAWTSLGCFWLRATKETTEKKRAMRKIINSFLVRLFFLILRPNFPQNGKYVFDVDPYTNNTNNNSKTKPFRSNLDRI